jgi:hypothetical protein
VIRRRFLALAAAAGAIPLLGQVGPAQAAIPADVRFRAMHRGAPVGTHSVTFRQQGDLLKVSTRIDITVKVMFFTAFRFKHDAEETWQAGKLVSVQSTTEDNGTRLKVAGHAAADGFRIIGEDGPFLAPAQLLTSNTLWDQRLVHESRLIDVQHGGEVGLVAKRVGEEVVTTPRGRVQAERYQVITPHYAGSIFYDSDGRWVKGLIEQQGEILEYALAN